MLRIGHVHVTVKSVAQMSDESAEVLSIDGREVRITHPDKPYFSRAVKLSKLDLVRYFPGGSGHGISLPARTVTCILSDRESGESATEGDR